MFEVIPVIAEWLEMESRALYVYLSSQLKDVLLGKKEHTESETTIKNLFIIRYIEVRLSSMFLIEVSRDLLLFLNTFEKEEVKIHIKYEKIAAKFLSNAGLDDDVDSVTAESLLEIDPSYKAKQLALKDIFLGKRVDQFLKGQKLERNDGVLEPWIRGIREFYVNFFSKLKKYYKPSLQYHILKYCAVLSPETVGSLK